MLSEDALHSFQVRFRSHSAFRLFRLFSLGFEKARFLQLDIADVESFKILNTVLKATTDLTEALKLHHERLSDESLHSLIQAEDSDGLKGLLEAEHASMDKDKGNVAIRNEMLDGMAGKEE